MIIFFWCVLVCISSYINIFIIIIVIMKKVDNSFIVVYQKRLLSEVIFVILFINGIFFKLFLDDEFYIFCWEEYLRFIGIIVVFFYFFKVVSIIMFLIYLFVILLNVYVDNIIKKCNR